jgi:hypothetical protein
MANMSEWRVRAATGMEFTIKLGHVNNTQKNRDMALGIAKSFYPDLKFEDANWICNGWSTALEELRRVDGKV